MIVFKEFKKDLRVGYLFYLHKKFVNTLFNKITV